jgi:hypothetical protein
MSDLISPKTVNDWLAMRKDFCNCCSELEAQLAKKDEMLREAIEGLKHYDDEVKLNYISKLEKMLEDLK